MSKLQAIENALMSINDAVFQELCDSYLMRCNKNYSAFSRTGSMNGKQKTKKGRPDSFIKLSNGNYLTVEHSTNTTDGIKKLKKDVVDCLDETTTGIAVDLIEEIVLCINFDLNGEEIKTLEQLLSKTNISLSINTLSSLSIDLFYSHRDLVSQHLGIPLDTGQIVSMETFISEYNKASQGIATPLDNTFIHRTEEVEELNTLLEQGDIVILTGPPGVGKSKLSIEAINNFILKNSDYTPYAISYKHHTLLEDMYQYLDKNDNYIVFVDDANRNDSLNQIVSFYKTSRKGNLKFILTVRDYAYHDVIKFCHDLAPSTLRLNKLTDEQIKNILELKEFNITDYGFQKEVIRIADGNPRIAIMAAILAKTKSSITALHDVSNLFTNYFTTFINDFEEFNEELNFKCLGLISFFYALPYKEKDAELTSSLLKNFDIEYSDFIEAIDVLDRLELVERRYEYVKIPEQNLSSYFFYRAFIKDEYLSFNTLLENYFENFTNRFLDCVVPANNTFGADAFSTVLKPKLQNYLNKIYSQKVKVYPFLSIFWYYIPDETLEFIYSTTKELEEVSVEKYDTTYDSDGFSTKKDKNLNLLSKFFGHLGNLGTVLELTFEYARRKPEVVPELISKLNQEFKFDWTEERNGFPRQSALFDFLYKELDKDDFLSQTVYLELAKNFLTYSYNHAKSGRSNTISIYDYPIPNTEEIKEFRDKLWRTLEEQYTDEQIIEVLECYPMRGKDKTNVIMNFDSNYIVNIIQNKLSSTSFRHCDYVQDQINSFKDNGLENDFYDSLLDEFTNRTYKTFVKISWDRLRDKKEYEFDDFYEYERLKEQEIRASFKFQSEGEVNDFMEDYMHIFKTKEHRFNYEKSLDIIIDENMNNNFELGCSLLRKVLSNNHTHQVPRIALINHLKNYEKLETIKNIVSEEEFEHKSWWQTNLYSCIDESIVTQELAEELISVISGIDSLTTLYLHSFEKYFSVDPQFYLKILRIISDKIETSDIDIRIWYGFFDEHFEHISDDLELCKKVYLQQSLKQDNFDYLGKGMQKLLEADESFLIQYVENIYSKYKYGISTNFNKMSFIWNIEGIEMVLSKVFDLIEDKSPYIMASKDYCNTFFQNLDEGVKPRADAFLLKYIESNYTNSNKMNMIVDIARNARKEIYEQVLLKYIGLNQDVSNFGKIWWRGNGGTYSGDVIIGDVEAADWRNILEIVSKSDLGIKLLPIKKYINERISQCTLHGENERKRKFINIW